MHHESRKRKEKLPMKHKGQVLNKYQNKTANQLKSWENTHRF